MKIIKTIILSILILLNIQVIGATNTNKDDLVKLMSEDKSLTELLRNSAKFVYINSIVDTSLLPQETLDLYINFKRKFTVDKKNIEFKYPLYAEMNLTDKKQIISIILSKSNVLTSIWTCMYGSAFGGTTCSSIAVFARSKKFVACMGAAGVADLIIEAFTEGANTPLLEAELNVEARACLKAYNFTDLAITETAIVSCLALAVKEIIKCF